MASGAAFAGTALSYAAYVWFAGARQASRKWLTIAILAGPLVCLPLLGVLAYTQKKYDSPLAQSRSLNPERYIAPLGEVVLGENSRGMRLGLAIVFVAAMATGARRHPVGAAGAAIFCGTWATLTVAQIVTGHSVLGHSRYFSPGLMGGMVALAVGLDTWGRWMARGLRHAPAVVQEIGWLTRVAVVGAMLWLAAYNSYDFARAEGDGVRQMVAALIKRPEFLTVLPEGAPFQYEFLKQGAPERHARALLIPRGLDAQSSATANALVEPLWAGNEAFFLVVYNNKTDPLDGVLAQPPAGWVASERLRFGDTRAALMMPAVDP
jgi:hypothetical protein